MGLPVFGQNASDVLVSAALTSASELGGGVLVNGGTETYSSAGITFASNATLLNWFAALTAGELAQLLIAGTVSFEVESGALDTSRTSSSDIEAVFGMGGSGFFYLSKFPNSSNVIFRTSIDFNPSIGVEPAVDGATHIRVVISWIGNRVTVYFDGLPYLVQDEGPRLADQIDAFIGIGTGQAPNLSITNYGFRNFEISTKPVTFGVSYGLEHISCIGHSFMDYGDYKWSGGSISGDADGNPDGGGRYALDILHSSLAINNGMAIPQGYIRNAGTGGAGLVDLAGQITEIQGYSSLTPIVFCQIGTNDINGVKGDSGDWPTDYNSRALYKAGLQTELDKLLASGANHIFLAETISLESALGYLDDLAVRGLVGELNEVFAELDSENTEVHVVSLFAIFGGDEPQTDGSMLMLSNNIHPNAEGHRRIGTEFYLALLPYS